MNIIDIQSCADFYQNMHQTKVPAYLSPSSGPHAYANGACTECGWEDPN